MTLESPRRRGRGLPAHRPAVPPTGTRTGTRRTGFRPSARWILPGDSARPVARLQPAHALDPAVVVDSLATVVVEDLGVREDQEALRRHAREHRRGNLVRGK